MLFKEPGNLHWDEKLKYASKIYTGGSSKESAENATECQRKGITPIVFTFSTLLIFQVQLFLGQQSGLVQWIGRELPNPLYVVCITSSRFKLNWEVPGDQI